MRYEVVEELDEWIVRREGCELGRFPDQGAALNDVAARLRAHDTAEAASLSVHYMPRRSAS